MKSIILILLLSILLLLLSSDSPSNALLISKGNDETISSPTAGCLNNCSGNGTCSSAGTCICNDGYLAVDCSIKSSMSPMCWLNDVFCAYWVIQDGYLYFRVHAETNPKGEDEKGWAAISWGAKDGMTNGQITLLTVPTANQAQAIEYYSIKFDKPSMLVNQTIAPINVTGYTYSTGIDVSIHRLLSPNTTQHFNLPAVPGTKSDSAVALGSVIFEKHSHAHSFQLDWAGAAINKIIFED